MKKTILPVITATLLILALAACTKKPDTVVLTTTCSIVINDTIKITADSAHWDQYSGSQKRMQAFKNGTAVFTMWPSSITSGALSLGKQYLYWIYTGSTIYTPQDGLPGTASITNNNNILTGTIDASQGLVWSGGNASSPQYSKVHVDFANVKQL